MFFICGTDTNVGKTLVSAWICCHTGFSYFKPIQTGTQDGADTDAAKNLAHAHTYPEIYRYSTPVSPHLAADIEGGMIDMNSIQLPSSQRLIVEGAGGVLVPLNTQHLMIDLIKRLNIPVIVVARTTLGTINHTLLTLNALHARSIPVLGVIMNGLTDHYSSDVISAIEWYGSTSVLAECPYFPSLTYDTLKKHLLPQKLMTTLI
jgi:dethiobiotin synthetase